ncbi:MAG: hypothetical protein ACREAA_01495 [Candidatus Polarisedimenticolia bacterium]
MTARRWAPAVVVLALVAALLQTRSYDVGWHLEAGEWIAAARAIPRVDDFSFTDSGTPWIDHEWLFQLVLFAAFSWIGLAGVFLLKAAAAAATLSIGVRARLLAQGSLGPWALALAAVSVVGMRPRLAERPEIVAFPLAAAITALGLSLAARPAGAWRRLAAVALLTALWVNLHASALLAPMLLLAVSAGCLADRWRTRLPVFGAGVTAAAAGMAGLCLIANPYTTDLFLVPRRIASALAPSNMVNPEWASPSWGDFPLFYLCAIVMALSSSISITRGAPLAASRAAVLAVVGALGFWSIRHIGIFFAVMPLLAPAGLLRRGGAGRPLAVWPGMAACLAAVVWMLLVPPPGARIGIGIQPGRFPVEAAAFADAHLSDARLYNDVAFGGYLIRDAYPRRRVFVDGRNEVHASLLNEMSKAMDDGAAWQALLSRYGVEGAIVQYRPQPVAVRRAGTGELSTSTWSELHFPLQGWALVHWDDVAMVFVRRDGKYAPMTAASEYHFVRPEAFRLGLGGMRPGAPEDGMSGEVARRLSINPGCPLAKEMAAVYGSGNPPGR